MYHNIIAENFGEILIWRFSKLGRWPTLKALCHAIRADCLLIEATRTHIVINNGHGGWLISSHAHSNLPAEARSAGRSTFQALCRLSGFYLLVFLLFWLQTTGVCGVLNLTIANSAECLCTARIRSPRTSVDYTVILGVSILPVPTLIEFLN